MPVIIGWFIGKMIGKLIVALVTLLFHLMRIFVVMAIHAFKLTYAVTEWILGKVWQGGKLFYDYYRLNLR